VNGCFQTTIRHHYHLPSFFETDMSNGLDFGKSYVYSSTVQLYNITVRADPTICEIAKYDRTPNQVTLARHVARDTIIVPKSTNNERQNENTSVHCLLER
jgi:hypothetical protein